MYIYIHIIYIQYISIYIYVCIYILYIYIWKVRNLFLPKANIWTLQMFEPLTFDASWLSDLGFRNLPLIFCEPLCLQQWNL